MTTYTSAIDAVRALKAQFGTSWNAISPEDAARMQMQNRFKTGLDIAKYTAAIMRRDMAEYDADSSKYTQSLGCWHGFVGQQKMIANKKYFGTTEKKYLYLSGWMVAALRSEFGPLPDQSMHEKTSVPALIEELYTFLRQADAKEMNDMFRNLKKAQEAGDNAKRMLDLDRPFLDWVSLAKGHGVAGTQVTTLEGFANAMRIAAKEKGPRLIELVF